MKNNLLIYDITWDRQFVRDETGKVFKLYRGKDYDTSWEKLEGKYGKDKKSITWLNKKVFNKYYKIIDFATFEIIEHKELFTTYFKDKNNVYVNSYMCVFDIIPNANPKTFKILDFEKGFSSSDGMDYWYKSILQYKLSDVQIINECYQKVKNEIYYDYLLKVNCDLKTFKIVHPKAITVAKDKNNVFFKGKIVEGANPKTFHFLEECIGKNAPYYLDRNIMFYAKDDKYAYFVSVPFLMKTIKTKDLENFRFEIVDEKYGCAFDSTYRYYNGKRKKLDKIE